MQFFTPTEGRFQDQVLTYSETICTNATLTISVVHKLCPSFQFMFQLVYVWSAQLVQASAGLFVPVKVPE